MNLGICQQSATATHHLNVQPYATAAASDCRSVLAGVSISISIWGLVCYLVRMGHEYPGPNESELGRMCQMAPVV